MDKISKPNSFLEIRSEPYTHEEILALGDELPQRGTFCTRCQTFVPNFADLSENELREIYRIKSFFEFKRVLTEKTGCSEIWGKICWLHRNGAHTIKDAKPCPFCGNQISPRAKQCLLCKMDWHDSENPVSRGESTAEKIISAKSGEVIELTNYSAWLEAISFVYLKRPHDEIDVVYKKQT